MYGCNHRSNYEYSGAPHCPPPTPRPGTTPVTAGHWRTSPNEKRAIKPRLEPRPTSGRGMPRMQVKPVKRRTSKAQPPTGRELHAAWAKGSVEF